MSGHWIIQDELLSEFLTETFPNLETLEEADWGGVTLGGMTSYARMAPKKLIWISVDFPVPSKDEREELGVICEYQATSEVRRLPTRLRFDEQPEYRYAIIPDPIHAL